jgi:tripartite-type tricarboxylate transporter receptor subunit TctC
MSGRRQFIQSTSALGLLSALGVPLVTQAQSVDTVKFVNGFPAGGTADATSRRIAERLRGEYAKNALVENKTGAGGRIAVDAVKAAAPDGTTLLVAAHSTLSVYMHIYPKLSYNIFEDLMPVSLAATFSHGLAVGPMVPDSVKTLKDFVAWCKANPNSASYASPAAGSVPHFTGAMLGIAASMDYKHVPYRGSVPGVADVVGGNIASMVTPVGEYLANYKAGKLRILATSGPQRTRYTPDVPTFVESGFPQINWTEWFGVFAPAKTPPNIINALSVAISKALMSKEAIEGLATFGLDAGGNSPAELGKMLKAEYDRWGPIVKQVGFTAES